MKNIKYYCSYGCDTHLSTEGGRSDFHNIMYVMHVFHTEDDVQYSCGVMNKLLSNVLAESLVWRIFTMTCDF